MTCSYDEIATDNYSPNVEYFSSQRRHCEEPMRATWQSHWLDSAPFEEIAAEVFSLFGSFDLKGTSSQ